MIDAHNHLDFEAFDLDRSEVVSEAREHGVTAWVLAATHPDTWARTEAVAAACGGVAGLGVHPAQAPRIEDWDALVDLLCEADPDHVGEIGLDRRVVESDDAFAWQVAGTRAQLALARELDRPVVFHCVGAWPELLSLVRRDGLPHAGGMLHGWSGPPDRVEEALALGLAISFGPALTRPHAPRQLASARAVPLDRLLIETDCPDQIPSLPAPSERSRGVPADLVRVAAAVAEAHDTDLATVARATRDNARRLFGLGSQP